MKLAWSSAQRFALIVVLFWTAIPLSPAQQNSECNVRITLLQLNDVYQFSPVDQGTRGGVARVLTVRKIIQKENPNTLFLFAGDTISPSVESITYKGAQMIEAWNSAGLDYATFGNHEFDFGPEVLKERMKESRFGWIAANVIEKTTGKVFGNAEPFVIREFGGVKIGIFGLVLPDTKTTSRPGGDVEFLNPCETARSMVTEIHKRGAKVVVALTHLSMGEDKEVARCSGVNLIIGGHEHTLLESSAGGVPILKMTANARELGRIDLNISKTNGELNSIDWKVIPITSETAEDPMFSSVYRKYSGLLAELDQVVGRTLVSLDGRSAENRTHETNIGNLVADSYRKAMAADVALVNGGSIRVDEIIRPGKLTVRDVLSTLPFKARLIKIEVSGALLRQALENGVSQISNRSQPGGFPQVSGIQFSYDASHAPGQRIVELKVNGEPVAAARKYSLATTTFVALDGGDGYAMLKGARVLTPPERAPLDSEALRRAILGKPVAPKIEGRVQRLDKTETTRSECE